MKTYICIMQVEAEACTRAEAGLDAFGTDAPGHHIVDPDGLEWWVSNAAFEAAYTEVEKGDGKAIIEELRLELRDLQAGIIGKRTERA